MPVTAGPFHLVSLLGHGGMGQVWRAVHPHDGVAVAVKVLLGQTARDPWFTERFHDEVRAVAALDHPNVVRVLDAGLLSADLPADSEIPAGSPWLAMELAEHGSLASRPCTWSLARATAMSVLDALAHAHARGLLHRDVKPANVLLMGEAGRRIVLSDFGLAGPATVVPQSYRLAGTPGFMAPEQERGLVTDLGPWTDLYALGRTIWALITGHATGGAPRFGFPAELVPWIERMTAHDPGDRFRFAADAAFALSTVPEMPDDPSAPPIAETAPTLAHLFGSPDLPAPTPRPIAVGWLPPPIPEVATVRTGVRPRPLDEVGRGMWGIRAMPLVGRAPEVAQVWDELRAVARDGRPRAVVLTGPSGVGKSHLGSFVATRAHEVGAAHAVQGPAIDGLANRPVVAWLDNRPEGLREARRLLEGELRVLALCTVGDDALAASEALRDALRALQDGGASVFPVQPLGSETMRLLVHDLLGLSPALAASVEGRAHGIPAFAVDLVGHLVESGRLVWGDEGWTSEHPGDLPLALPAARVQRVEALIPEVHGAALELAAVLGAEVELDEWSAMCRLAGLEPAPTAWAPLCDAALARRTPTGFRFATTWVREAVVQRAAAAGRVVQHHDVAARWLATVDPRPEERLGRHLVRAGRPRDAVEPLCRAASEVSGVDPDRGLELYDEALAAAVGIPDVDPIWGRARMGRVLALAYSRPKLALAEAEAVYALAVTHGWPIAAMVARHVARFSSLTGDLARALTWCDQAALRAVDPIDRLTIDVERGYVLERAGRITEAAPLFRAAADTFVTMGRVGYAVWALVRLAHGHRMAGDLDTAAATYREALGLEGLTDDWRGDLLNGLAEIARLRGDPEAARPLYEEALDIFVQQGSNDLYGVILNLAMLDLDTGGGEARDLVAEHLPAMVRAGKAEVVLVARGVQAAAAAIEGDFDAFDGHFADWVDRIARSQLRNDDLPRLATQAARAAEGAGEWERAARAWQVAADTWGDLGRTIERDEALSSLVAARGRC